jgi:hypothetical protein
MNNKFAVFLTLIVLANSFLLLWIYFDIRPDRQENIEKKINLELSSLDQKLSIGLINQTQSVLNQTAIIRRNGETTEQRLENLEKYHYSGTQIIGNVIGKSDTANIKLSGELGFRLEKKGDTLITYYYCTPIDNQYSFSIPPGEYSSIDIDLPGLDYPDEWIPTKSPKFGEVFKDIIVKSGQTIRLPDLVWEFKKKQK